MQRAVTLAITGRSVGGRCAAAQGGACGTFSRADRASRTAVVDQPRAARPVDGDDSGSASCDKSAFELEGSTDCHMALKTLRELL